MDFTESDLPKIAKRITQTLRPGDVLALSGPLAAGKTTLTKAIARIMGYQGPVISPTFVLERHYPVKYKQFRQLTHLDFYRLTPEDLTSFDWRDYLGEKDRLTVIEWPEIAAAYLPTTVKRLNLEIVNDHTRRLIMLDQSLLRTASKVR